MSLLAVMPLIDSQSTKLRVEAGWDVDAWAYGLEL